MKWFWHIIAVANTILFATFIYIICTGKISISTDSWVHGYVDVQNVEINKIPSITIEQMPTVEIGTPVSHPRYRSPY